MRNKKPPFEITNTMIHQVAEIAELVGKLTSTNQLSTNPTLRRINRIRTIHGSLAIEQNTLSLEQVTAVLNGKQVLASPKDIAEVKNAYEIYERLDELDPYSADDLLMAHGIMTQGLVKESGVFRSRPVGVVDQEGRVLHIGTLPNYVPDLVMELLDWVKGSDIHMLIRSCVFHYELELIHPFADGNGRIGRLWHTLLLSKWNPAFAWLPVESMVYMYKSESSDELKFEFFLDDSDKYKNEFYTQMKEHCRPCQEYFFEKSRDFVNRIAGQPIKIEPSLIEQAEIARKMLFADNAADDTKTDIFTKKRYALNDREYMSYLYNSKVLKYKRIFVCSNHVNGLLSYSFCSQLNVLAEKIPVFLIYNKNEYGAEKTIRYFFKNPSSNLFLIASEEVDESIICFDSELAMYLQENAISAFERPVVYTMSTCDFDKKAVSKLSGMLIARYNLAGYLSETSTQNNASPRKQKSNN